MSKVTKSVLKVKDTTVLFLRSVLLLINDRFYQPYPKVVENMSRAQKRDACVGQKFWFRKDFLRPEVKESAQVITRHAYHRSTSRTLMTVPELSEEELVVVAPPIVQHESDVAVEMSLNEIFNGKV